jgi:hypothetical protein
VADYHRDTVCRGRQFLKRKHVTLSVLWDECVERNLEGYRYSRFCEVYRSWERKLSVTMRQTHGGRLSFAASIDKKKPRTNGAL